MAIAYLSEPRLSLVVSVWRGIVTPDEWRGNLLRMLDDPVFPSTSLHLADLRSAQIDGTIEEAQIADVVAFLAPYGGRLAGRRAAILAGKDVIKVSVFERLIQRYSLTASAFTFLDAACSWLAIDPAEIQRLLRTLHDQLRDRV